MSKKELLQLIAALLVVVAMFGFVIPAYLRWVLR